jgi:hypothetical protein
MMTNVALLMVPLLMTIVMPTTPSETSDRPRLIILTDISSLTPGVAEPDDGQSLIRLMLYSNDIDIQGLIATSNLGQQQITRPDLVRRVVDAYATVQPNLLLHDRRYPPASTLRAMIKAGQPLAGRKTPIEQAVGPAKDTEASNWIIHVVDEPDPRPVWILIWGGSTDLAQALWKIRETRKPADLAHFVSRLRVHSINDQDSTGPWIRDQFPDLYAVIQRFAYRGMYRGGDSSLVSSDWVRAHIHGHGALGELYPDYKGGDIWSSRLGQVRGIKEGDTPSFLSLVPNGLTDVDHPWLGSWGGRFAASGRFLTDVPDQDIHSRDDPDPRVSSVYRWRPSFQADFQARLDWCVKPFDKANHPPKVLIAGKQERTARLGEAISLDASHTTDPDGDHLTFAWTIYPAPPGAANEITIEGRTQRIARVVASPRSAGKTVPILLSVTDQGTPPLSRYAWVLLTIP